MDKVITTSLLIVISMVMAMILFSAAFPAAIEGGNAITNMANRTSDRMRSQVEIILVVGELDRDGWWQDTNMNGEFEVFAWVKNVGSARIIGLDNMDVFFGTEGGFVRIPHQNAGSGYPYWSWELESGSEWLPTTTLKITIHYQFPLSSGQYFLQVTTPNGTSDEYSLGI